MRRDLNSKTKSVGNFAFGRLKSVCGIVKLVNKKL